MPWDLYENVGKISGKNVAHSFYYFKFYYFKFEERKNSTNTSNPILILQQKAGISLKRLKSRNEFERVRTSPVAS